MYTIIYHLITDMKNPWDYSGLFSLKKKHLILEWRFVLVMHTFAVLVNHIRLLGSVLLWRVNKADHHNIKFRKYIQKLISGKYTPSSLVFSAKCTIYFPLYFLRTSAV